MYNHISKQCYKSKCFQNDFMMNYVDMFLAFTLRVYELRLFVGQIREMNNLRLWPFCFLFQTYLHSIDGSQMLSLLLMSSSSCGYVMCPGEL